jgi:hypothetical protein
MYWIDFSIYPHNGDLPPSLAMLTRLGVRPPAMEPV